MRIFKNGKIWKIEFERKPRAKRADKVWLDDGQGNYLGIPDLLVWEVTMVMDKVHAEMRRQDLDDSAPDEPYMNAVNK